MAKIHVLVAEDDDVDGIYLERLFKGRDRFQLTIKPNGLECFSYLNKLQDIGNLVVLCDVNMPVLDGLSLLKKIREDERLKNLPVFILTISAEDSVIDEALKYNVNGYLLKPISIEEFESSIEGLFAES